MLQQYGGIQAYVLRIRRDLHKIPEIGLELPETEKFIKKELDALNIPYVCSERGSGIMATIEGAYPGKTIAFRTDMDALQLEEELDIDYKSLYPGYMHACGHDAHMAIMLGTARMLLTWKDSMHGVVRLIFQPGEETARGAEIAIEDGYVKNIDAIFGLHIGTLFGKEIPCGKFIISSGCCMASYDHFIIKIKGESCHGSNPEKGIDPVQIASHLVLALQAIQTRELMGTIASVISIGKIIGGNQYNVIPDSVILEGTTRAVDESVRQYLAKRIEEIANMTAMTFGGECEFQIIWGAPPVVNDRHMADLAADAIEGTLGIQYVERHMESPCMAGEDFANYLNIVPGAFLYLSSSNTEKGTDYPHHSSRFNIDEDVLWEGVAGFNSIAKQILQN